MATQSLICAPHLRGVVFYYRYCFLKNLALQQCEAIVLYFGMIDNSQFRNPNLPPFYNGELVVATHPATKNGNLFKYGQTYRIVCEWKEWYNNKHKCWVRMWYIGFKPGECYYTPALVSSLMTGFKQITLEKIQEEEEILCAN